MSSENSIEVRNVTKQFKIYIDKGRTIKERALFRKRRQYERRQVLRGISFEVKKGEAVGLIGHNGCGKSTTLKLLTRILYPDTGSIDIKGRVSSLIELGAGFHPDLSGKENIYINAAIFGLKRDEIDRRLDDIIAFSELEDFIDNPVRTYSSGMYMRLAFSVAINVDADVLLIDEILAVGDANFQIKCFNKLQEIKGKGTTIVIVSHSLEQIEQICDRTIWIHEGLVRMEGASRDVHPAYLDYMEMKRRETAEKEAKRKAEREEYKEKEETIPASAYGMEEGKRWGNGRARIVEVRILDQENQEKTVFKVEETIKIHLRYQVRSLVKDAVFGLGFFNAQGLRCYGTNTNIDNLPSFDLIMDGEVEVVLPRIMLLAGVYTLDMTIEEGHGMPVDYYREVATIEITNSKRDLGVMRMDHQWIL